MVILLSASVPTSTSSFRRNTWLKLSASCGLLDMRRALPRRLLSTYWGVTARIADSCDRTARAHTRYNFTVDLVWGGPVEQGVLGEIWSQARRATIHDVPAFTLSAHWEFLYFAVHAARHGLSPIKWLVDLDLMCSRGMVDWQGVSERARRLG